MIGENGGRDSQAFERRGDVPRRRPQDRRHAPDRRQADRAVRVERRIGFDRRSLRDRRAAAVSTAYAQPGPPPGAPPLAAEVPPGATAPLAPDADLTRFAARSAAHARAIARHRETLCRQLGRDVGEDVATLDYCLNANARPASPPGSASAAPPLADVSPATAPPPRPVHPGEILRKEFLIPLGLTPRRLARDLSVPSHRIREIVQGKRAITPNTALRLARCFGTSERFWLNLQTSYDLEVARDRLAKRLAREVLVRTEKN